MGLGERGGTYVPMGHPKPCSCGWSRMRWGQGMCQVALLMMMRDTGRCLSSFTAMMEQVLFFSQLHEIQSSICVPMQHRPSKDGLVNSPRDTPFLSGSLPGAHLSSFGQDRWEQRSCWLRSRHKSNPVGT